MASFSRAGSLFSVFLIVMYEKTGERYSSLAIVVVVAVVTVVVVFIVVVVVSVVVVVIHRLYARFEIPFSTFASSKFFNHYFL